MSDHTELQRSYDALAEDYAARIAGELAGKPFDRAMLRLFAEQTRGGHVVDAGCGPGHVTRFLADAGADVSGCDVSPAMVRQAQRLNPGIDFSVCDLHTLAAPARSLAGIVAFYSLIHTPREALPAVLAAMRAALRPGGLLLAAFHLEDESFHDMHLNEMWGHAVSLDFMFFRRDELEWFFRSAGFALRLSAVRAPYRDVEVQTRRAYLLAEVTD